MLVVYQTRTDLARKPRIVIVEDDTDVSTVLSGGFQLKNYEVFKASSAQECIDILKNLNGKVDAILISGRIAADRGSMLIIHIRKTSPAAKILVLADEDTAKTRVLDYGADEFALKPMSLENVADKVFNLITRGHTVSD